jgi:hypothetical protein
MRRLIAEKIEDLLRGGGEEDRQVKSSRSRRSVADDSAFRRRI